MKKLFDRLLASLLFLVGLALFFAFSQATLADSSAVLDEISAQIEQLEKRVALIKRKRAVLSPVDQGMVDRFQILLNQMYARRSMELLFLERSQRQTDVLEARLEEKDAFREQLLNSRRRVLARGLVSTSSVSRPPEEQASSEELDTSLIDLPVEGNAWSQQGQATFYAGFFEGRNTASGVPFSNQAVDGVFYAAHRELPFGTLVRVTNVENGKSVVVRIVDRGPYAFPEKRIIDLAQAAFEQIAPLSRGITNVFIVVVDEPGV